MNTRLNRAKEIKEFLNRIKNFKNSLRQITIDDLELSSRSSHDGKTFTVLFPSSVNAEFSAITEEIGKLEKDIKLYELYQYIFCGTASHLVGGLDVNIQILVKDNRLHVTQSGIAPGFRNLGLGIKFYKKVLREVGYFTSYECDVFGQCDNALESDLVWESLSRDSDIRCEGNANKLIACYAEDFEKYEGVFATYLKNLH